MSRFKRYWKDEYKYKRILEILEDYWLTEEDEEEVTVTMHFKHADGREQEKEIWWRNPNIENQPNEIKGVTLDELFAEHDAIDAVEVVHGEWIPFQRPNGGYYTGCSICSFPMPTDSMCDFMDETDNRFCYNCGAKMDGERIEK